jgi:hypothetical protein
MLSCALSQTFQVSIAQVSPTLEYKQVPAYIRIAIHHRSSLHFSFASGFRQGFGIIC